MDMSNFSENGQPATPKDLGDSKWWKLKGDEVAQSVGAIITFLDLHQSRVDRDVDLARLYGNVSLMGLNGLSTARMASVQNPQKDRVTYNIVQSAIDTVTSKIAKNKPKPLFLSSGGDYKIQRKAKKLDKFIDGIFYENRAYELGPRIFRDGALWGDGLIHVYRDADNRVRYERVLPLELKVDEVEAIYGKPRSMYRVKDVDRAVLLDHFPEHRKLIMEAPRGTPDGKGRGGVNVSDCVTVREAWHLPSSIDAKDGKRAICLHNGTIDVFDWKRGHFPFARFSWNPRPIGYWAQGGAEQIENIQLQINRILWLIQRSMHLAGTFKVALENSSKVAKSYINNDIGTIIPFTTTPPQYLVPPIVQPEIYQHLTTLVNMAYEKFGISQLSAAAKKPEGLDSGKALREFNDIESDRYMTIGQAYEQCFLDLARLSIEEMREISEDEGDDYEVKVPGKKFIETINWKDIDLEDDDYIMKMYPVSSLPNTPEGRLSTIQEYIQAGFIRPKTGRKLLDFPDLEAVEDLANSQENYLNELLEKIIDDNIYTAPEPYDDLQLALELGLEYYAQGKCNGLEEEKLDNIVQFIEDVKKLIAAGTLPPMPAAGAGGAPQANPMPTPQSDMVPNTPGVAA